jgi:outer membrane PBP1 activator LpoA protein
MIAPQLAAAGLGAKPRVATSQLLSGTGKPEEDSALDGIAYPTETWTARGIPALPSATSVGARLKTAKGPAARLFAFGYDAWLVTAYLEKLALDANAEVRGATGTLRIDGFGNVLRTPTWSTFSGGTPMPLADGAR